jgi:hypothetical protein
MPRATRNIQRASEIQTEDSSRVLRSSTRAAAKLRKIRVLLEYSNKNKRAQQEEQRNTRAQVRAYKKSLERLRKIRVFKYSNKNINKEIAKEWLLQSLTGKLTKSL